MHPEQQWEEVNSAFTRQSHHFDEDDLSNPVLQMWRKRIYRHVDIFLKPNSDILELNSGTGIDAVRFARQGHHVHATDLSNGMIEILKRKVEQFSLQKKISVQQVSFEELDSVDGKFDFIFSNFGGLNCASDLKKVTQHFPALLKIGGHVTLVIMPRTSPWEWLWVLKGKFKMAFRRWKKSGADSHLEGHHFLSYYYSLSQIKSAMPLEFKLTKVKSLGCFSPPPAATGFVKTFPGLTKVLNTLDAFFSSKFLFNRCGDHLILTFSKIKL